MSGADSLLPPEGYSTWVLVVGGLLLLAVAAWYAYVLLSTRRPRPEADRRDMPGDERSRYTAQVEEVLAGYRRGEHDLRSVHLELARIMREFASERIGRDVRSWTRAQIADHDPTTRVGQLLAGWEEPSFARDSDAEAAAAAGRAREVIARW